MTDKKTILVVEDERSERFALRTKLSKEGYDVLEAKNGKDGLKIAAQKHPDLILLDIVMPIMDGMTMLKELRADSDWGKVVPVIIITNLASDDEQRMRDVTETEPSYYLVKTESKIEDIMAKINDALQIK